MCWTERPARRRLMARCRAESSSFMMSSVGRPLTVARGGRCRPSRMARKADACAKGSDSVTKVRDAVSDQEDEALAMRCRKKVHDALSVRTYFPAFESFRS